MLSCDIAEVPLPTSIIASASTFVNQEASPTVHKNATIDVHTSNTPPQQLRPIPRHYSNRRPSTILFGRVSIFFSSIGFLLPLSSILSFGNKSFLDTSSLSSIGLLSAFCVFLMVQLIFMYQSYPLDVPEHMVYGLLLVATIIITSLMYYQNYLLGIDGMKNFILNMGGLLIAVIAVVFEYLKELFQRE